MGLREGGQPDRRRGMSSVERYGHPLWMVTECLAGGIIVGLVVIATLPTILDLLQPFTLISTTAFAAVVIFAWFLIWVAIGFARRKITTAYR